MYAPQSPTTAAHPDAPLLPDKEPSGSRTPARASSMGFISSPLNPNAPTSPSPAFGSNPFAGGSITSRSRPVSRGSMHMNRIASEESQALSSQYPSLGYAAGSQRGSMLLYRLASDPDPDTQTTDGLLPPNTPFANRASILSQSGESIFSLSSDSKYPQTSTLLPGGGTRRKSGFVPYLYDPDADDGGLDDDEDALHAIPARRAAGDPSSPGFKPGKNGYVDLDGGRGIDARGIANVATLLVLIGALVALFVFYPVFTFYKTSALNAAIDGNFRVNSSGQVPSLCVSLSPFNAYVR